MFASRGPFVCNNSDGANFCDCQRGTDENGKSATRDKCEFYGRRIEPLAWSIEKEPYLTQQECPLFAVVPQEVRIMIFGYALTDCTSHPPNRDNVFRQHSSWGAPKPASDIATALLRTCRAVYLETYKLPLSLNPLNVYDLQAGMRPVIGKLAPWQFGLLGSLDLSMPQIVLERGEFADYIKVWKAAERSNGAYVTPRYFHSDIGPGSRYLAKLKHFRLDAIPKGAKGQDGDEVSIAVDQLALYDKSLTGSEGMSMARAMLARPLTRLTLRLVRTDWWTWDNPPENANGNGKGALEMDPNKGWGEVIAGLSDLKTLELVLETFEPKKLQLERVVEFAKAWRIPLMGTQWELVWDGRVEEANWVKEPKPESEPVLDPEHQPAPERSVEESQQDAVTDDDVEDSEEDDEDHSDVDTEYGSQSSDDIEDYPVHPVYVPWYAGCTQFEVRIVRYVRQKVV